ncbi:hypothetical protein [Salinispora tropica]|uniref:Uncharacterized protein n=1 Tax=Salinispora tropica (strain ATCC BAA-916 / DSM 44818 / JCM 13857 / NBRC 105044 / CNB-440) TaxID=369723 RepID=A4X6B4_SALTO|nr:hypothetical protein [Salinispora tropica]ABP54414.1 hypothetical protein Strop_1954 [Salinispora tropica CNB-440]
MRFVDAKVINPFKLLVDLHAHAVARTAAPGRDDALAELALSAAVLSWWTRWQPTMIHAAPRSKAGLADIGEATGLEVGAVVRGRRRWTDVQSRLDIGGRPATDPVEVRTNVHRRDSGVDR